MILVPVKNFYDAKKRLSPVLSPAEREALAQAMLRDVSLALAATQRPAQVALVTSDAGAVKMAGEFGFQIIEDREQRGESHAIALATVWCCDRGEAETLVLPADIPLVTAPEIERIFTAAPPLGTVMVSSREQRGSNAVLRRPASLFTLKFGDDSFLPHLRAARKTGKPCIVLRLAGIALDVDGPGDLAVLLSRPGNTQAQKLLRSWGVSERLAMEAASA